MRGANEQVDHLSHRSDPNARKRTRAFAVSIAGVEVILWGDARTHLMRYAARSTDDTHPDDARWLAIAWRF
jgi:hypothetical protein